MTGKASTHDRGNLNYLKQQVASSNLHPREKARIKQVLRFNRGGTWRPTYTHFSPKVGRLSFGDGRSQIHLAVGLRDSCQVQIRTSSPQGHSSYTAQAVAPDLTLTATARRPNAGQTERCKYALKVDGRKNRIPVTGALWRALTRPDYAARAKRLVPRVRQAAQGIGHKGIGVRGRDIYVSNLGPSAR